MAVKLSYFKLLAKGVAPMFCLEVGEMEWEAVAVDLPEWGALKATGVCPFVQLPILETPDVGCMSQSASTLAGKKTFERPNARVPATKWFR
ncbi:hypothetical protein DIPPA_35531 [Diplonema papillatum]|nr:hypothetical protein DIPPA_35531 [Diplonema papillatum]